MMVPAATNTARSRLAARAFAVAALVAMLPACNASGSRGSAAQRMGQDTSFSAYEEPVRRRPLVYLPNSGSVTSVQETRTSAGLHQHITYAGQGGGHAELALTTANSSGDAILGKPTRVGIATELASLTPDGPYRVLTQPHNNAYGPFGIAVSSRCAYAWQWISDTRGTDFGRSVPAGTRITASLRIHHCRRGPTYSDALVTDLVRLRLGAGTPFETSRHVRRVRPPSVAVDRPVEAYAPGPTVPVAPRPQVVVNGSRTLVSVAPEPSPPAGRTDSRYLAPRATQQPVIETTMVPRPGAAGSKSLEQPRYLTDLAAPSGPARMPEPSLVASPRTTARAEPLSPDLPTQAYRGPTPPPFGW